MFVSIDLRNLDLRKQLYNNLEALVNDHKKYNEPKIKCSCVDVFVPSKRLLIVIIITMNSDHVLKSVVSCRQIMVLSNL